MSGEGGKFKHTGNLFFSTLYDEKVNMRSMISQLNCKVGNGPIENENINIDREGKLRQK